MHTYTRTDGYRDVSWPWVARTLSRSGALLCRRLERGGCLTAELAARGRPATHQGWAIPDRATPGVWAVGALCAAHRVKGNCCICTLTSQSHLYPEHTNSLSSDSDCTPFIPIVQHRELSKEWKFPLPTWRLFNVIVCFNFWKMKNTGSDRCLQVLFVYLPWHSYSLSKEVTFRWKAEGVSSPSAMT